MMDALKLRKELDPDAPDAIAMMLQDAESAIDHSAQFNRILNRAHKEDIIQTMVEAQHLADRVVDLAIDWHKSDMGEAMDAAQTLEDAIEELVEFRRKMPIVKQR